MWSKRFLIWVAPIICLTAVICALSAEAPPSIPKTIEVDCPACGGSGLIKEMGCPACEADGIDTQSNTCDTCHGSGRIGYSCPACKGEGKFTVGGKEVLCKACLGKGYPICTICKGKGKISKPNPEAAGTPTKPCEACGGTGFEQHAKCAACSGKGKLFFQVPRPGGGGAARPGRNQPRPPPVTVNCPFCGGDGEGPPLCPQCRGKGYVGSTKNASPCPACAGTGKLFTPCSVCGGRGFLPEKKSTQQLTTDSR